MKAAQLVALLVAVLGSGACASRPHFYVSLTHAPEVTVNTDVTYRGVKIGRVDHIGFRDTLVVLSVRLLRRDAPITEADSVRGVPAILAGIQSLEIIPAHRAAAPLAPGDTLPGYVFPRDSLLAGFKRIFQLAESTQARARAR